MTKEQIQQQAQELIANAVAADLDVTITLVPQLPLAMGNHKMVAEVVPHKPY